MKSNNQEPNSMKDVPCLFQYSSRRLAFFGALALTLIANVAMRAQEPASSNSSTAPSTDQAIVLSPFEVSDTGNTGYSVHSTNSSSRVAENYIDVPQAMNVFTSEFIDDFNITDMRQLYAWTPNISISQSQFIWIRGIPSSLAYLDGVATSLNATENPYQFYDRIEIVKGPSSAAFGLGEPAGIVNYISKVPTGIDKTVVQVGVGDHDGRRFNVDTQGRLSRFKDISYRAVIFYDNQKTKVDTQDEHHGAGVQLALRDDFDNDTSAQLIMSYSRTTSPVETDVGAYFKQPSLEKFLELVGLTGGPNGAAFTNGLIGKDVNLTPVGWLNAETHNYTRINLILDKSFFNKHINIHSSTVYDTQSGDRTWGGVGGVAYSNPEFPNVNTTWTGIARYQGVSDAHGAYQNLDVDSNWDVLGGKWRATAGANYLETASTDIVTGPPTVYPDGNPYLVDIYHPDLSSIPIPTSDIVTSNGTHIEPVIFYWNHASKIDQDGYYINLEGKYFENKLTIAAGWREDWFHQENHLYESNTFTSPGWQDTKGAPRFSITYKPFKWLSAYVLDTKHSDPVDSVQRYRVYTNNIPDATPAELAQYGRFTELLYYQPAGSDYEAGIKAEFFDGRLQASVVAFKESSKGAIANRGLSLVGMDGNMIGVDESYVTSEKINGAEAEVTGQLGRRLQIVAEYGLTRGLQANSTAATPLWVDPPAVVSMHAKADLGDLHGKGLYLTFGGAHYGGYYEVQAPYVYQGAQWELDGGLGYKWDRGHQNLYLNVNNFLDHYLLLGVVSGHVTSPREQAYLDYTYSF